MLGFGSHSLDNESLSAYPDGEILPVHEELGQPPENVFRCREKGGMTRWVHGIPMHPDGELQEELGKLPGKGRGLLLAVARGWVISHLRPWASVLGKLEGCLGFACPEDIFSIHWERPSGNKEG